MNLMYLRVFPFLFLVSLSTGTSAYSAEKNSPALSLKATDKDDLFTNQKPVVCNYPIKNAACKNLCVEMKIQYDEMRDVNGQDVDPKHALTKPERFNANKIPQREILIPMKPYRNIDKNGSLSVAGQSSFEVGDTKPESCKWATIFVHGADPRKGNLGVTDNVFGGAFNRMKRLAIENNGLYYSPHVDVGSEGLAALVKHVRTKTCPKGKIILNCGSAGVAKCWDVVEDKDKEQDVSGLVLIGSGGGPTDWANSNAVKAKIPILFAQGEKDYPEEVKESAMKLHAFDPNYPVRFLLYGKGGHMTPLRMLDWREAMNCMLAQAPDVPTSGQRPAGSGGLEKPANK